MPAVFFAKSFCSANMPKLEKTISAINLISASYIVFISTWLALWLALGDRFWWLTILNRIVPFLFLPAPVIFLLAIKFRRLKWAIQQLVPLLIFLSFYAPYVIPHIGSGSQHPNLSIMTFNALFSNTDYEAVARVIRTHQPDFVTLQEIQPVMMNELKRLLADNYPYSLMGDEHPYGTTAIFSRHPPVDAYVLELQIDRTAVVFKSEIKGTSITVIAAHLLAYGLQWVKPADFPKAIMERTNEQQQQARQLVTEIQQNDGMVVLGCDCNSKETSGSYRILDMALDNAARASGWSLNGMRIANAKRDANIHHIDYLFFRGSLYPLQVFIIKDNAGSDHSPILGVFEIKE